MNIMHKFIFENGLEIRVEENDFERAKIIAQYSALQKQNTIKIKHHEKYYLGVTNLVEMIYLLNDHLMAFRDETKESFVGNYPEYEEAYIQGLEAGVNEVTSFFERAFTTKEILEQVL